MVSKYDDYALESLLYDIMESEYIIISKYKVWRLLGKGSGAAGTFKAFLDAWEELYDQNKRADLHGFEYNDKYFFSNKVKTTNLLDWAGEK